MNFLNTLSSLAQISNADNPSIFPFPFVMHITLAIISVIFFGYRFAMQKKPFQLIFAIAVPLSLVLWISENKTLFYCLGLVELLLILAAIVTSFVCKPKKAEEKAASEEKKEENQE